MKVHTENFPNQITDALLDLPVPFGPNQPMIQEPLDSKNPGAIEFTPEEAQGAIAGAYHTGLAARVQQAREELPEKN